MNSVPVPGQRHDLLIVDADTVTAKYSPLLHERFRVNTTARASVAVEYIKRTSPALVVTDVRLEDGSGIEVCRVAKQLPVPATALATADAPEIAPDVLAAGCDAILLKPFAPNLLVARVGRLLRERSTQLRLAAARSMSKSQHLSERIDLMRAGTNRVWPHTHCPYCSHAAS